MPGTRRSPSTAACRVPWRLPGAIYHRPSDEHGILDVTACSRRPARGDKVLLVPGHCDPTVNLHDWYVGVRGLDGGRGAGREPVAGGGARRAVLISFGHFGCQSATRPL